MSVDYEKLSQESLDNIMNAIRAENRKAFAKQSIAYYSDEPDKIKRDAELEPIDAVLAEASVGTQIGQKKAPMYRRKGLAKKAARLLEAVYLRIAEFTNRDLRSFATAMIEAVRLVRMKLERLFLNDQLLENELRALRAETDSKLAELHRSAEAQAAVIEKLGEELTKLRSEDKLRYLTRRIGALEAQSRAGGLLPSDSPAAVNSTAGTQSKTEDDIFYHDFEERFRGSYEDIRSRLEVYKPILTELLGSFEGKRFVDLGCGRGEMLDFLRSSGAESCVGVDINSMQLEICSGKGFETAEQDCIEYLRGLEENSIDAISAIQLVEHLPFEKLKELFAECERVVKKGGVIIFETPNCNNLITASAYFYMDPSHIHPLPPELLRHMAECRGFNDARIVYANPDMYSNKLELCPEDDEMSRIFNKNAARLNELLYGPQDYALIGVKR